MDANVTGKSVQYLQKKTNNWVVKYPLVQWGPKLGHIKPVRFFFRYTVFNQFENINKNSWFEFLILNLTQANHHHDTF